MYIIFFFINAYEKKIYIYIINYMKYIKEYIFITFIIYIINVIIRINYYDIKIYILLYFILTNIKFNIKSFISNIKFK